MSFEITQLHNENIQPILIMEIMLRIYTEIGEVLLTIQSLKQIIILQKMNLNY